MISGTTFVKNSISAAICLYESMASLLPYVDEMIIVDLGSDDGTIDILRSISISNPKINLQHSRFSCLDAKAFADIANECVTRCKHNTVLFWQADEVWHDDLLWLLEKRIERGHAKDLVFWRYQLKENFQVMKWLPHPVHRLGPKNNFNFIDDGMNTDRTMSVPVCSSYGMEEFGEWYVWDMMRIPYNEMILDVSRHGGFFNNVRKRSEEHAPMWNEEPNVDGVPIDKWEEEQRNNPNWKKTETPFNIPMIMRYHLAKPDYVLRDDLLEALKQNKTKEYIDAL